MRLYLMRHGPAEDVADSGRDYDRLLTKSGRSRVLRVAELLLADGDAATSIHTSPLLRTKETAALVAGVWGLPAPIIADRLASGQDARGFVDGLLVGAAGDERIMLVGHEPDMSELTDHVLQGEARERRPAFAGFEKAMVVIVEIVASRRVLLRTIDPRKLGLN